MTLANIDRRDLAEEVRIIYDNELQRRTSSEYQAKMESERKTWGEKIRADGFKAPFRKMRVLRRRLIWCLVLLLFIQFFIYLYVKFGPGGDYLFVVEDAFAVAILIILLVQIIAMFKLSRLVYGEIHNFAEHGFRIEGGIGVAVLYTIFPVLSCILPLFLVNTFVPKLIIMYSLRILPTIHLIAKSSGVLKKSDNPR